MKRSKYLLFIPFVLVAGTVAYNYPKLDLISGFSAKNVASAHFIDGRSLKAIEEGDNDIPLVSQATNSIDEPAKSATSSVFGLKKRTAIYREGLGAVLIDDDYDISAPYLVPKRNMQPLPLPFPYGNAEPADTAFANINYDKLTRAVDNAFDKKGQKQKRTRSVLIIYKDKIIGEKYADGFSKTSKILGWSMTKSITATMFGILQHQKKLNISAPAPIAEWQKDNRKKITVSDLLHMNSGLQWDENYEEISDATTMLFKAKDMTRSQIDKPAVAAPNMKWNYSSGTSNLLSGILRKQFATHQQYLDFWYSALIDKIGMQSTIVETDMSGNYVGSSYCWATTRDWAKFGLLYLHNGNWNGEQLFDESWVRYVTTPTNTSNGRYGAHFWLNAGEHYPDAPRDMYSANGFQGQMIFIIPSRDLVIVRMGLQEDPGFNFNLFLKEILASIEH
ncbi:MAG TPA: serine hydrolase [Flavobacterium sp.]|nr:serine hydrolase [Flavobacterium sp.]